ncbi:MAG: lantibiotic dehydratase [Solirubrobacteraceae bacterium]
MQPGWTVDGFVLRTPLRPIEALQALGERAGLCQLVTVADRAQLERLIGNFRRALHDELQGLLEEPVVAEAVYLSSPAAWDARRSGLTDDRRRSRTDRTLWGYAARISRRATPFGTLAGWSVGSFGAHTDLELPPASSWERETQLDLTLVDDLIRTASPGWSPNTPLRPSPCQYVLAGRIHNLRTRAGQLGQMVAIAATEARVTTLAAARTGSSAEALIERTAGALGDEQLAREVVSDLIERELLVPAGALPGTGGDPCAQVIEGLRSRPGGSDLAAQIERAAVALEALDERGLGVAPESYRQIVESLQHAAGHTGPEVGDWSQTRRRRIHASGVRVGLIKRRPQLALGPSVLRALERSLDLLRRVDRDGGLDPLDEVRAEFAERYEHREVRLVEALDPQTGISVNLSKPKAEIDAWHGHLLRRLQGLRPGDELALADDELPPPVALERPLPDSLALIFTLAAQSEHEIDAGNFEIVVPRGFGPPAAKLLGRFCCADADVRQLTERQLRLEEDLDPDAIYAELVTSSAVYPPSLSQRPVLRAYELEYGGLSGADPDRRLQIGDLMISLDNADRFVLRSAQHDRRVEVRIASAINLYELPGAPMLRFLAALEAEGRRRLLQWSWGGLAQAGWLPRVRHGRCVLSLAIWRLEPGWETGDQVDRMLALRAWRKRVAAPRHVQLLDGREPRMWLDLENPVCQDLLAARTCAGTMLILQEQYPPRELEPVHGPEGRYAHEFIVPITRAAKRPRSAASGRQIMPAPRARPITAREDERCFVPGSSWLTAKLYCHPAAGDDVLRHVVAPLRRELIEAGVVELCHFLRYADPRPHLRVRLFARDPAVIATLALPALNRHLSPALTAGRVWRLQLDTYWRELERYGGVVGAELTERLWHADTEATLAGLDRVRAADRRWLLALVGVHRLMCDFGLDDRARRDLAAEMAQGVVSVLGCDRKARRSLSGQLRERRTELEAAIEASTGGGSAALAALDRRSHTAVEIYAQLRRLESDRALSVPAIQMLGAHLHLHVNRVLRGGTRWDELRIYDALERVYGGHVARAATPVGGREDASPAASRRA